MPKMTAQDIINRLTHSQDQAAPGWIRQLALEVRPSKRHPTRYYDTTRVNFFPEVTVRIATDELTRRGHPKPQRRRIDLLAIVQANYKAWQPFTIGVEIKVDPYDLARDTKIEQYFEFCHYFFLAVPLDLTDAAQQRIKEDKPGCGLLVVEPDTNLLFIKNPPLKRRPTNASLAALYAELLIRPFRLAGKEQTIFFNYQLQKDKEVSNQ